jgi:hypothetical protein
MTTTEQLITAGKKAIYFSTFEQNGWTDFPVAVTDRRLLAGMQ